MGTPVDGGTLLHLAVYWDESDMAEWLLDRGSDPNVRAARRRGRIWRPHATLQCGRVAGRRSGSTIRAGAPQPDAAKFVQLLIARGADPNARASIRMRLGAGHGDTRMREFRDVTPLSWGRRFAKNKEPSDTHREILFVNTAALQVLEAHGGRE